MSAAINSLNYAHYFEPAHYDDLLELSLPWFADNCRFESDEWELRSEKNAQKSWILKLANEPIAEGAETLGDSPELLRTVKLFLLLVWASKRGSFGLVVKTPESLYKTYSSIISLIRYLKYVHHINNLSSINKAVAETLLEDYVNKTFEQRLNVESRAIEAITTLFSDIKRLESYKVFYDRSGGKPCFDHTRFSAELGLSMRSTQGCKEYQKLRHRLMEDHGFRNRTSTSNTSNWGETKTTQTSDSIRKPLNDIRAFFKVLHRMNRLFPVSQQLKESWLSSVKIPKIADKAATSKRSKTRDIPRKVFYKLMDEAIRWVLDYADDLFSYQKLALSQYDDFLIKRTYKVKSAGTDANKAHYATKQMTEWFKQNQPDLFPYPIEGLMRSNQRVTSRVEKDSGKVEQARALYATGITMSDVAIELGCSKATVNRWINSKPPLNGISLNRVINTHLVSASLLVLFAFTGRRKDEIMGLEAECIEVQNNNYFITIDQEKKNQGKRSLPTTKLVAKAVEVLSKLTAKARQETGSSKLLKLNTLISDKTQEAWPDFNDFCEFTGIENVDDGGHYYSFAAHQFRRFLAMTYWYRYPDPDLPTLTYFLGHEDSRITMDYITDKNGQWAFRSVKNERIIDLVEEEFKAGTSVIGHEIESLFGVINAECESRAKRMEKKGDLVDTYVLNFVSDGACFGKTLALKGRSKCLEFDEVQLSASTFGSCHGCPNLIPVSDPMTHSQIRDLTISQSPMLTALKQHKANDV